MESSSRPRVRSYAQIGLLVHILVLAAMTALFAVLMLVGTASAADANIGGAAAGVGVGLLGLPWSVGGWSASGGLAQTAWAVIGAWLNVALHAAVVYWRASRPPRSAVRGM